MLPYLSKQRKPLRSGELVTTYQYSLTITQDTRIPWRSLQPHKGLRTYVPWIKPSPGFINIDFDFSKNHYNVATAFVIKSWKDCLIQAGVVNLAKAYILVA